ncbi:MAG: ABC transporter permease [Anaerolineae bacterium]|nr:ABC transporter permease [Anaerolineae bacterium]MDQ7036145.1 ABC transporter permease [Anaerolineae bacterium]
MFRLLDIVGFTIERIWQHIILVFWVLVGIGVATTLALSLPLYVDSVYTGILESRLDDPPYAYRYRYLGAWNGNIGIDDMQVASSAIENRFVEKIGLPEDMTVRYVRGGTGQARFAESNVPIGTFGVGSLQGNESQIIISAGEWNPAPDDENDRIPLLLPEVMLFTNGIQVGDEVTIQRQGGQVLDAYVAALWRAINPDDPSWIFPTRFFEQVLLVEPQTLLTLLEDSENPIDEVAWMIRFDGSGLRTSEIDGLLVNSADGWRQIERVLPGIRPNGSPDDNLRAFNAEVDLLTQQLFIIILPVGGLVLYFVSLVAGLLVSRQQAEDVTLRSRGMSRGAVLTVHVLMWLMIIAGALAIALVGSPYVVQLIGQTASFLNFTGVSSVTEIVITREALMIAVATGFITASSGLFLAWQVTRQNINSLKRMSISPSKAWWQRAYLDIMAIVPAIYVLWTLQRQDGIQASADTPFADPLTFVGPTLFAFGLTLLFLRILPMVLGILARIVAVTSNISFLMALRELTRSMGRYRGTLLMTAFTLSLTGFTASMASTLDASLIDVINYRVGSDLVLVTIADAQTETSQDDSGQTSQEVVGYNAPPIGELLTVEGIETLSRLGKYDGRLTVGGQRLTGTVIGVDRAGLAAASRMRSDFSAVPLAEMLNDLAGNRTGIILDRQVAEQYGVLLGEELRYQVRALDEWQSEIRAVVVGFIDYFPTVDPSAQQFYLITSIEPIFEVVGTVLPYNIWVDVAPTYTAEEVQANIEAIDFPVLRWIEPQQQLEQAQAEPARRGVLGFLSIGFVASITLTLIGAVIQSTASFRAQSAQLGSLRAMGLSGFSVRIYIILLQGMVAASGILSGTAIGVGTSRLFLPYFDFSGGLPPYQVRVDWTNITIVYLVFAGVLLVVTIMLSLVLSRQQLSNVVKLGDT